MASEGYKLLAKNTLFLYFRMIVVMIVSLFTSRIVLKNLGINDFGIYNVVGSVVVFFSFIKSALTNATYRYITYELGVKSGRIIKVYSMAMFTHIMLALAFFVALEIGGVWFINNHLVIDENRLYAANWAFQFSLLTFVFSIIQTPLNSNIIAHEKMNFFAIVSIVETVIKLAIAYMITISPIDKLVTYSSLLFFSSLIMFLMQGIYCKLYFSETRLQRVWDKQLLKEFASYSGLSVMVNSADICSTQSMSIFVNWFVGVVGNAALGITNQVNSAISQFVSNFAQAFNPRLIKTYASGDQQQFLLLVYSTTKMSFALFAVVAFPIFVNIEYILQLWLGEYPAYVPSFVRATFLYYFIDAFQAPLFTSVHATGNIKLHHSIMSVIKFSSIPVMYMVFKCGGSAALAILSWASLNIVGAVIRTLIMKRLIHLDVRLYISIIFRLILLSILTMSAMYFIKYNYGDTIYSLLASTIIGESLTCIFFLTIVAQKNERDLLFSLLPIKKIVSIVKH